MGLLGGESCMILTLTVFDWSTRVSDGRTDRQTDGRAIAYARYSIFAVARKKQTKIMWFGKVYKLYMHLTGESENAECGLLL